MDRTRWNDDLPTYLSERFYTKDEIDQLLERLSLQSGLLFNLSSPNSIIQSGDTNTFHTELTWSNGAGLEDKDIVYEVKHGETLIDLETVQTDVDGVAEYEYTGTGVGEVTVTAKYGSLLQETYSLEDYLFYDSGIDDDLKNNNYVNSSSVTVTTDSTGTLLDIPTNGHSSRIGESTTTTKQFSSDIILELDVISSSKMQVRFRQSNDISRAVYLINSETPSHYRFRVANGLVYRSIDGGEETTYSFERTGNFEIWLQARESNASLKFKNLKIYSA